MVVVMTRRVRVLLVDDEPASRLTMKAVLEEDGYLVDSASSLEAAVERSTGERA